jgi:hypothetical protein
VAALGKLVPATAAAAAPRHHRLALPLLCLAAAVALEVLDVGVLGSSAYYHMLEEWGGGHTPQLLLCTFIFLLYTAIVFTLAAAASGWRRPPRWVRTAGSTTLGCYVMHWYFMPITGYLNEPWAGEGRSTFGKLPQMLGAEPGLAAQLSILLLAPLAFQLTLGAAFHKAVILQIKALIKVVPMAAAYLTCCCRIRSGARKPQGAATKPLRRVEDTSE